MFIDTAEIARRKELGARIHRAMVAKDWRQSDLSRATDLSRESISSYINGKTWPHDTSIKKIATALGVNPLDLVPEYGGPVSSRSSSAKPSDFEMRVLPSDPTKARVQMNKVLAFENAVKIATIVREDTADGK